jgi:hypothetical protein
MHILGDGVLYFIKIEKNLIFFYKKKEAKRLAAFIYFQKIKQKNLHKNSKPIIK